MALEIKTNNQWRDVLTGFDLTFKEAHEFDYMDNICDGSFFRYKGQVYSLGEFTQVAYLNYEGIFPDMWHAYLGDSFFSGILIHLSSDGEQVKVATYYS